MKEEMQLSRRTFMINAARATVVVGLAVGLDGASKLVGCVSVSDSLLNHPDTNSGNDKNVLQHTVEIFSRAENDSLGRRIFGFAQAYLGADSVRESWKAITALSNKE